MKSNPKFKYNVQEFLWLSLISVGISEVPSASKMRLITRRTRLISRILDVIYKSHSSISLIHSVYTIFICISIPTPIMHNNNNNNKSHS